MDATLKTKWLEALRSGKYEQGRCLLRSSDDKFCCLGVLCDVADVQWSPGAGKFYAMGGELKAAYLPDSFKESFGINDSEERILTQSNDDGSSFADIANYIEANL